MNFIDSLSIINYVILISQLLIGYCGVQYCACTEENSMSLAADEAGSIGTVGSNCEEDWVEIEGIKFDDLKIFLN